MFNDEIFERNGLRFRFKVERDDNMGRPWEEHDGHGPVREGRKDSCTGYVIKKPGERVLYRGGRGEYTWVYDWAAACNLARKDGWNVEPFDAPNHIERAVQADFDRLRRWCDDKWYWIGVVVERLGEDDEVLETESLWGIESDSVDYLDEVAFELADQMSELPLLAAVLAAPGV